MSPAASIFTYTQGRDLSGSFFSLSRAWLGICDDCIAECNLAAVNREICQRLVAVFSFAVLSFDKHNGSTRDERLEYFPLKTSDTSAPVYDGTQTSRFPECRAWYTSCSLC